MSSEKESINIQDEFRKKGWKVWVNAITFNTRWKIDFPKGKAKSKKNKGVMTYNFFQALFISDDFRPLAWGHKKRLGAIWDKNIVDPTLPPVLCIHFYIITN